MTGLLAAAIAAGMVSIPSEAQATGNDDAFNVPYVQLAIDAKNGAPRSQADATLHSLRCGADYPAIHVEGPVFVYTCGASERPVLRVRLDESGVVAVALITAHGAALANRTRPPSPR